MTGDDWFKSRHVTILAPAQLTNPPPPPPLSNIGAYATELELYFEVIWPQFIVSFPS